MEVIQAMLIKASETNTSTQSNTAMAVFPRPLMRLSPRSHPRSYSLLSSFLLPSPPLPSPLPTSPQYRAAPSLSSPIRRVVLLTPSPRRPRFLPLPTVDLLFVSADAHVFELLGYSFGGFPAYF